MGSTAEMDGNPVSNFFFGYWCMHTFGRPWDVSTHNIP